MLGIRSLELFHPATLKIRTSETTSLHPLPSPWQPYQVLVFKTISGPNKRIQKEIKFQSKELGAVKKNKGHSWGGRAPGGVLGSVQQARPDAKATAVLCVLRPWTWELFSRKLVFHDCCCWSPAQKVLKILVKSCFPLNQVAISPVVLKLVRTIFFCLLDSSHVACRFELIL